MELTQEKNEQSVNPSKSQDVLQDQDAGMMFSSAEKGLLAVELKERNDSVTVVEKLGSELMSTSESIEGGEILMEGSRDVDDQVICAIHPDSTSVSVSKAPSEIREEGVNLRDKETMMSSTVSGFDSQQESSRSSMVIQEVHEMTLTGAENLSAEQIKSVSSSSKAERSKENIPSPISNIYNENTSEFNPSSSQEILKEDYSIIVEGNMPDLRFLVLFDTRIRTLPSSLFTLSKLKVIMLRNCVSLDKLPTEIENLNHLEVLDLSGTELYCLPDEIGQLTGLKHLQLSFYGPDDESEYAHLPSKLISPGVLSHLKALQALGIIVHLEDHRWAKDEVESAFDQGGQCLRFVNGNHVPQVIEDVLIHVTAFYLDHHSKIQSLSEFGISNFKALQLCVLRECPNLKMILDDKATEGEFSSLEHLGVYYLWKLECIWKLPSPPQSLQALKYLTVSTCPKLHFILWKSMLQCLSNLEELVVEDCESVEVIIKEEKKTANYDATVLPRLRKVVLRYLPELVSLGNGLCISEENISSYGCPKLVLNSQPKEKPRAKHRKFLSALRFRHYRI
ncbi:UNVERIFIED_CONTAM: hypothetical protein Slati_0992900 [Sesamum latifolium]|uniref:Disease resistance protein n=1 Tax=Sesamum latifolium TaxID=2727402 RepID=A0AAW2XQT5_9LAMI